MITTTNSDSRSSSPTPTMATLGSDDKFDFKQRRTEMKDIWRTNIRNEGLLHITKNNYKTRLLAFEISTLFFCSAACLGVWRGVFHIKNDEKPFLGMILMTLSCVAFYAFHQMNVFSQHMSEIQVNRHKYLTLENTVDLEAVNEKLSAFWNSGITLTPKSLIPRINERAMITFLTDTEAEDQEPVRLMDSVANSGKKTQ